jgi:energy-coupling factor transport system permease protein
VIWFILFVVATNVFTQDGTVILEIGGFIGTYEGLVIGAILSAKLILLFWIALLFAQTTPAESILEGIEVLLSPVRNSLGSLIMLVTITFNFIPSLVQLAQRIRLGYLARGIDIETGITRRLRYLSSAQVPLFRRAFRMSDQLALAMEARCYEPSNNRTMYSNLKLQTRDWIVMTGASTLFVALAIFGS